MGRGEAAKDGGAAMMPELERRRIATNATLARYQGKTFSWKTGITCAHMARGHLRNMKRKAPAMPRFRSAYGAKQALKALGHDSMVSLIDSLLPRIAPAQMVLGDLCAVEGEAGMDAVMICAGHRRIFGWVEDEARPVIVEPEWDKLTACWRV